MYLIDTNILIYFFDGQMNDAQRKQVEAIFAQALIISVISKIEFLGFEKYLNAEEFQKAKEFIAHAQVVQLTDPIIDRTIALRQAHKMKLADALIAATALEKGLTLVTRNTDDFKNVTALPVLNPLQ